MHDSKPSLSRVVLLAALALVSALRPAPSASAPPPQVFAEFEPRVGALGVRKAQLFVDGRDVTASAEVSGVRVAWAPSEPLAPGEHSARAVVTDALGNVFEKEWTFEVAQPVRAEVLLFLSKDLVVTLDPLPRETRAELVAVTGSTLPNAEVELRNGGALVDRALAGASGRFRIEAALDPGANDLTAFARRLDTAEAGREARGRVVRIVEAASVAPPSDVGGGRVPAPVPVVARPPLDAEPKEPEEPQVEPRQPPSDAGGGRVPAPVPVVAGPRIDAEPKEPEEPQVEPRQPPSDAGGGRVPDGPGLALRDGGRDLEALPGEPPATGTIVITKPDDGDAIVASHVTVLGGAPAGLEVTVLVNGSSRGADVANPAGHFTVPRVTLEAGRNELVAQARTDEGELLQSSPVVVLSGRGGGDEGSDPAELSAAELEPLAAPGERLELTVPSRRSIASRGATQRVEGHAWPGAQVEVEVNGRVVARDVAATNGRFAMDAPLEPGLNTLRVEAWDERGRSALSGACSVTRPHGARAATPPRGVAPIEFEPSPGRRVPTRALPADSGVGLK